MSTLRVGIVGCGVIFRNHVEAYQALPEVEVVAVLDADRAKATERAAQYGIGTVARDLDELLSLGLDIVSVCTPHPTHEAIVLACAAAGVHVLCEKPIAVDLAAAERMTTAAEQAGVRLGVVFQRRFWPAAQRLRAAIEDGPVGAPILGHCSVLLHREHEYYTKDAWRGTWAADGGGVLMTQAVHYIDLLQWFMGRPVEVSGHISSYEHRDVIEVEDTAVATIVFESGALATLSASTSATPALGVHLTVTGRTGATMSLTECPEGTAGRNDIVAVGDTVVEDMRFPEGIAPNVDLLTINEKLMPFHAVQVQDFVDAVRTGREPAVTGEDATTALRIIAAVYESSRTGQPVRLVDGGAARALAGGPVQPAPAG